MDQPLSKQQELASTGSDSLKTPERKCSECGLTIPDTLEICPNDGYVIGQTVAPEEYLQNCYGFLALIGEGGMSVIYKARHTLMDKLVAVKLLQGKLSSDAAGVKRFQNEAKAASRLDHPNVVTVYDFGILPHGSAYLVMDYLDGRSLGEIIKQDGPLEFARAAKLFVQICDGLALAHKQGVLHRDLKPSNIVIIKDGDAEVAKIVDFGIAKLDMGGQGKLTVTGEVFGSPDYMSPEQCMGQEVDCRSDVYSMGCLMFEALTGRTPHLGTNALETIFKHINEPPPALGTIAGVPATFNAIVNKALAKQPVQRYESMEALKVDIDRAAAGEAFKVFSINEKYRARATTVAAGGLLHVMLPLLFVAAGIVTTLLMGWFPQKKPPEIAGTPSTISGSNPVSMPLANQLENSGSEWHSPPVTITDEIAKQQFGDKNNYEKIDLRGALITDKALTYLLPTTRLKSLDVQHTAITDEGLRTISGIKSLRVLSLTGCGRITPKGIEFLRQMPLEELYLGSTNMDDTVMQSVATMNLHVLRLGSTKVSSGSIAGLAQLPNLVDLGLNDASLNDKAMQSFPHLEHLRVLGLASTGIGDAGLASLLEKNPQFWRLDLRNTLVTDKAFALLRHCDQLTNLHILGAPNITPTAIEKFREQNPQCKVD